MQPMNRKELEALVEAGYMDWLRSSGREVGSVITDAIREKMVGAQRCDASGHVSTDWGKRPGHSFVRLLICTDTPAPTVEADALLVARWYRNVIAKEVGDDVWAVREAVKRILEEATDAD